MSKSIAKNIYQREGYANREAYLQGLADNYGVDVLVVNTIADVLGETEDFDGLVTSVQDYAGGF